MTEVRDLARQHTVEAVETLAQIMRDKKQPAAARVAAANALLDRGYGRPPQDAKLTVQNFPTPLPVVIRTHAHHPAQP
jgi:hypothetical protein